MSAPSTTVVPGEGWRLVKGGEAYCHGDEYRLIRSSDRWLPIPPDRVGGVKGCLIFHIRRRLTEPSPAAPDATLERLACEIKVLFIRHNGRPSVADIVELLKTATPTALVGQNSGRES